jgi:hypothetical protein
MFNNQSFTHNQSTYEDVVDKQEPKTKKKKKGKERISIFEANEEDQDKPVKRKSKSEKKKETLEEKEAGMYISLNRRRIILY